MLFAFLSTRLGKLSVAAMAILLAVGLFLLWLSNERQSAVEQHEAEREAQAAPARETAANERVADAIKNTEAEETNHAAIDAAPKVGELSPAARALACERLRKLGRIPPSCRFTSGH